MREDLGCPTELKVVFANRYLHLCVCTRSFSADEGESVADSDRSPATTGSGTWPDGPGAADVWPHNQPSSFTEKLKRGSPRYIVLYVDILNFDIDVHQYTEKVCLENLYIWVVWS